MIDTIKLLAIKLLQEEVVIASWGITKVEIEDSCLRFNVNGLKYSGSIIITVLDNKNYEVIFGEHSQGIYQLEDILSFLDNAIEKTDRYKQDVEKCIMNELKN